MQTFLPYPDFEASARCLDYRRLGKQRVECAQIITVLENEGTDLARRGWINHPASRMWRGHIAALRRYQAACIKEWLRRGYRNTMAFSEPDGPLPAWIGDEAFHASHRSRLLLKDPLHYGTFGWTEAPGQEYVWPV